MESKASFVVLQSTNSTDGKVFNKCENCQHNHEEQEVLPLAPLGIVFKKKTDEEINDNEQSELPLPLMPPTFKSKSKK